MRGFAYRQELTHQIKYGVVTLRAVLTCLLLCLAVALVACGSEEAASEAETTPAIVETTPTTTALTTIPPTPATPAPEAAAASGIGVDAAVASRTLVQLVDPLDEPEFYCVDVPGFGASLRLQAALTAHTCKPGADDEIFAVNEPLPGNLVMPAYDLCMETVGTELVLRTCSDSAMQQFELDADGALALAGTELCVAVAPGEGEPTGGPSHVRRDLVLLDCGEADASLRQWSLPGPSPR